MALQIVMGAEDGTLGDIGMVGDDLLHRPGGEPVTGDIDDVVHTAHDIDIAVLVDIAAVAGIIIAGKLGHVGLDEPLVVAPQRDEVAGRQRQLDDDIALLAGREFGPFFIDDVDIVTGQGLGRRPFLDRQFFDTAAIADDGPAGLGLPPVVDDGDPDQFFGPVQGVGIETLTGKVKALKTGSIVFLEMLAVRVFLFDRPEGGRGGKQTLHPMLGDDPPEGPGVGSADRFALIEDRGGTLDQRGIDDIGVTDDPADIRG